MKILIVTETLLTGGAEWFVLRLCDALADRGHSVALYILRPDLVDERLTRSYRSVQTQHAPVWKVKLGVFLDRIIRKLGLSYSLLELLNSDDIRKHITNNSPDVIHSHLLPCDITVLKANTGLGTRHITTIHGDYIQGIKDGDKAMEANIRKAAIALDKVVVISEEQVSILSGYSGLLKAKLCKIYNGYPSPDPALQSPSKETFNFGMIARAIPEKGWEPSIKAFIRIKDPNVRLYLYGEGAYLEELRAKYPDHRILFPGFSEQPLVAISNIHVGLLTSYYNAESLPTTIIEYLAMSKPVIVSTVGEIPRMIKTDTQDLAGIIINSLDPEEMVEPIYQAMNRLMIDTDLYEKLASNCESAFKKFSMDKCLDAYLSVYKTKSFQQCAA